MLYCEQALSKTFTGDSMADDLQAKMDQYNEMLLKSTAITFSSEGISKDIKGLLFKKAEFVSNMLSGIAGIIEASSGSRMVSKKRARMMDDMVEHALLEIKTVSSTMNYVIARSFEREAALVAVEKRGTPVKDEKKKDKGVK
jgi:hypothetical protein